MSLRARVAQPSTLNSICRKLPCSRSCSFPPFSQAFLSFSSYFRASVLILDPLFYVILLIDAQWCCRTAARQHDQLEVRYIVQKLTAHDSRLSKSCRGSIVTWPQTASQIASSRFWVRYPENWFNISSSQGKPSGNLVAFTARANINCYVIINKKNI